VSVLSYAPPQYLGSKQKGKVLSACMIARQGRSQTFSFGGATGGASFATRGAVNGLCRTFRKRPTPVA